MWGYYFAIFALALGVGLLLLRLLGGSDEYINPLVFAALGAACLINLLRNRTLHCAITGPFFLLVAAALALGAAGLWSPPMSLLWPVVMIVVGVAFLLEWRFAEKPR
jgi:hypothetical protein